MAVGTPQAYAYTTVFTPSGTTFEVQITIVAGDGSACPLQFGICYIYDMTQGAATNIAAMKTAIVTAAAQFFPNITTDNVVLFAAVN
jgi:hypothetical protein